MTGTTRAAHTHRVQRVVGGIIATGSASGRDPGVR